jgi:hypothetical protein
MINVAFTLLVVLAACISIMTAGSLAVWLRGVDSPASPRLGLALATPVVTILLLILQLFIIIAAMLVVRHRSGAPTIMTFNFDREQGWKHH